MICSGNPPICTGPFITPVPEEWRLEITDLQDPDWVGTVAVDETVYDRCNLHELWPECSQGQSGDVR
ncbi:Gp85 [Mycolicibacterium canariasense]|uniref:Gp85 n=1 Tax=Mycolicibacterium canariasense TaxID=228230 RepID=A0A100WJE1_MYCCR|nr:Gp85 [Mycolicibacterium canariasense]